jgi:hypothetical protein
VEWNSGLIDKLEFVVSMEVRLLGLLRGVLLEKCLRNLRRLFMRTLSELLDGFSSVCFLDLFLSRDLEPSMEMKE